MSNATTITLNDSIDTNTRIDMRWVSTAINESCNANQAKKINVSIGNKNIEAGELFNISGNFSNANIVIDNSNQNLDYVGYQLPEGVQLDINGDCGHYSGAELKGGRLTIHGNTLDYTACAMRNGIIDIKGSSGHYTGSAYAGHKKGMSGGTVLIHKNSGDFTSDLMRRGVIMVVGDIGDYCGSRMIAGTITNLGSVGNHIGAGMRRGTLLFPALPKEMNRTFINCGRHNLGYLTLLLHELRTHDSEFKSLHSMRRRVQRYMGDPAVGGLGEILIWIG